MNEIRLARRDVVSKCLVNDGPSGQHQRGRLFGGCFGVVEGRLPEETRYWVSFERLIEKFTSVAPHGIISSSATTLSPTHHRVETGVTRREEVGKFPECTAPQ